MDDEEKARRARAEERRKRMTIAWTTHDSQVDVAPIRGYEAMCLVTELNRMCWQLAGLPIATYARHAMPIRFVRRKLRSP